MKNCPACGTTYTDDSLSFCLADGTALKAGDEEPTAVRKSGVRVDIPSANSPSAPIPSQEIPSKKSSGSWIKIVLAVVVLGIFAIAAFGLLGAVYFYGTGGKKKEVALSSPTPTPAVTPTSDKENERLRDELANIQKRLEEKKKTSVNTDPFPKDDDDQRGSSVTATVNSPGDGFLALRNIPDADRGVRIAKIPHGSAVELNNCEKTQITIAGRTGRWCQVEYSGRTGWVFDAWLDY